MDRRMGTGGALVLGLSVLLAGPAQAATSEVLHPSDIDFSKSGATGHHEIVGDSLHIRTGAPTLDYRNTAGGVPGFQLVIDFNGDGHDDGILVGEPVYHGDWWLTNGSAAFVKTGAPRHTGGSDSANHGTLDEWRTAFADADVSAFGFSLGSGVKGDGNIDALHFAGTTYTFADDVVLKSKSECKDGGWATSTGPTFRNQGACVSSFAAGKK